MNILIPYSWLKEYLETQGSPKKIAQYLSLCSASVEKTTKVLNDYIFEIEITTNRVDMMSVAGIAREAVAVLSQFGIKAKLEIDPYKQYHSIDYDTKMTKPYLKVIIKNPKLCPRFTAILLDNVQIKPSPKIIQERLKKVAVRGLNNVIDISNYLMHELGQPVHVFDYDKIRKATMILRESKKGEKITTLDGKNYVLPGNDIVIEDGSGQLIDLCGIMGGKNSCVDQKTKRVLLFVQNYEASHIRKTSMALAQLTEAATLFEKNVDSELVMPTLIKGIELLEKHASGQIVSSITDIYPNPYKPKSIKVSLQLIKQRLGVPLQPNKVIKILNSLGFQVSHFPLRAAGIASGDARPISHFQIKVPSWRSHDVSIPEDIVEEVARVYGYHNIPSSVPPISPQYGLKGKINPQKKEFKIEKKTKHFLANLGFTETYTYSLVSKKLIQNFGLKLEDHLRVSNPLSEEWEYLRTNLIPSALKVIADNTNRQEISIFEVSNIYLPRKENQIPFEKLKLVIASAPSDFWQIKGVVEALLSHLNISDYKFEKEESRFLDPLIQASIKIEKEKIGQLGNVNKTVLQSFGLKNNASFAYLDFDRLVELSKSFKPFKIPLSFPPIIEDLTFSLAGQVYVQDLIQLIKAQSSIIQSVKLVDSYKENLTFRITYQHPKKSLSTKEVSKIRNHIISQVSARGLGKLKEKATD